MNAREKRTVSRMIRIYCRSKHGQPEGLCRECRELEAYAHARLERCPFKEEKPACKDCPVHCYKPQLRQQIQEVMRFAGPRMLWYHPVDAILHLYKTIISKHK